MIWTCQFSWQPQVIHGLQPEGNPITGVFAERSGSAQTISIIENAGSTFSPAYKKWEFNLSDGSFFRDSSNDSFCEYLFS